MSDSDSSSDVELVEPPPKTRKLEGAAKYPTRFNPELGLVSSHQLFHSSSSVLFVIARFPVSTKERKMSSVTLNHRSTKALDNQSRVTSFFKATADPIHES